jgi:phosphoglucosamine mutase
MTAAEILRIMQQSGALLSALAGVMEPAPQVSVPVRIPPQWREVWRNDPEIASCIADCEQALGTSGRLLIREHPREPVLTVTVEGSSFQQINTLAMALAEHISQGTPAPQEA